MSFAQVVTMAAHLLFAATGLGLVLLGAWGSLPARRNRGRTPLAPKQRVLVTIIGLFFLAAVWNNMSAWLPLGR